MVWTEIAELPHKVYDGYAIRMSAPEKYFLFGGCEYNWKTHGVSHKYRTYQFLPGIEGKLSRVTDTEIYENVIGIISFGAHGVARDSMAKFSTEILYGLF